MLSRATQQFSSHKIAGSNGRSANFFFYFEFLIARQQALWTLQLRYTIQMADQGNVTTAPEPIFVDIGDSSKPSEIESLCMQCHETVSFCQPEIYLLFALDD